VTARIQLHMIDDTERVHPISVAVSALAYFHASTKGWTDKARSEALVNTRILIFTESFEEIVAKIDEALDEYADFIHADAGEDFIP
jgi:hypothetical protein